MQSVPLEKVDNYRYRIPSNYKGERGNLQMRAEGLIYASPQMIEQIKRDNAPEQVANVAALPGLVGRSLAMPDIHLGYGFCLTKDTKILTNFGFYKAIGDFEKDWFNQNLRSIDLNFQKLIETPILRFIKLKPKEVFRIVTKRSYEIKATGDHPLFTSLGMKPIKELAPNEKIAVFPFEGILYEKPSDEKIISEKDIKRTLLKLGRKPPTPKFGIILQKLKKRNLIPLAYNHPKLPYILKIMGFVFGDGSMNFIGKREDGILHFSGKPQNLEKIREDLREIGYTPSPIHFQKIKAKNKFYNGYSFQVNASSLVVFLETLGVPRGSKVSQAYRIPKWIFKAPLWQKRLFLASLFGCELRIPHRRLDRNGNFNAPVFPIAKREEIVENGKNFLKDISKLLKEFGVKTLYINKRKKHTNAKGKISWALELVISPKPENLFNLWSKIGFEYNSERAFTGNVAIQYLKLKQKVLKEKEDAIRIKIPQLLKNGLSYQKIAFQLAGNPLTKRFIIDVCYKLNRGKRVAPRIPLSFPRFEDYLKQITQGLGQSGMVWEEIKKIERIPYKDFVYDFTVLHSDHDFIANNFVVSNCIGGVAATDGEEGVISPGGVGFDINCLSGDTKVLHECGYTRRIKDFEGHWAEESIKCANFGEKIVNTRINALIKFKTKQRICRLTTESGEEITATEDHPFYTQEGMTLLRNIRKGDEVAVFPFQGIEFSEPSNKIILSEEDITKLPLKKNFSQTINELKKRNLLPLRMNNEKLPYLLKLIGFILGDGTIYFTGNKGTIWFYGEPEDLEDIKNDIEKLGFKASKVYKRKRSHEIKTGYGDVKFDRVEYSIKTNASSLAALMWAMGLPVGNKCTQEYMLPNWLFDLELWQKRLFLASLFGAELSSPSTVTNHGYNFYSPILSMNKHEEFLENARQFLKQIKNLLNNFGVKSSLVGERKEFVNKNGKVSYRLQLRITSTPHNLINLWGRIGFEYNKKRLHSANVAILYLKLKENVLKERARAEKKAKELRKSGLNTSQICEELQSDYINHRFIERSLYGGRKVLPRVAFNFPTFNEFMNKRTSELGKTGLVWDRIVERKIIKLDDSVYDFNVANEHHNFIANNFAVSNCGVRLLRTNLRSKDLDEKKIRSLVDQMFANVPSGVGSKGKVRLRGKEIEDVLERGAKWAVENDYGWERDLQFIEEGGQMKIANASLVSQEAKRRGIPQVGSLGAGNHFLELQEVQEIYNPEVAKTFGIQNKGQITVMIHTGSRGCGHQICTDYLRVLERAVRKYNISLPDRQLACAPVKSKEAQDYFKAMACGANFAFANRQMITHWVREAFEKTLNRSAEEIGLEVVYDVCHNIAKLEEHQVGNKRRKVYVHRKGATRAFGKGYPQVSAKYREVGQPVLIPGDMGTASYLLVGTEGAMKESWGTTCHGSGRLMSRTKARRQYRAEQIINALRDKGIYIHAASLKVVAEETPDAYKDVSQVVEAVEGAGISHKVAKMRPLGVVKG